MTLTVADALAMEELAGTKIVAGHNGLDRAITWVYNASVPDAADWLNGGEFVLTTALNMPEDEAGQRAYVLSMVQNQASALAIAVGRYIPHIPDYLREVADEHDLPLIEIPFSARFINIMKATNERIAHEHMAVVTRAMHINQVLTQLILDGGGLKDLARELAHLIGQSISIENERFEALASENIADFDEARRYTLQYGRTNPQLVQALEDRNVLPEIRRTLRPVFIPQMADVGLEMERILAPIVVHGEIYGYVWIIADDRPLNDLDRMAIQIAATVAALMLLHQEAIHSAEASLKGNLLSRLIQGETGREEILTDQTLRYGIDLRQSYVMLLVEANNNGTLQPPQLYRRINRLASTHHWAGIVSQFAGQVVLLAQSDQSDLQAIIDQIHDEFNGDHLRIGVSPPHDSAEAVALAYQQCRQVLYIDHRLHVKKRTVYFEHLGFLHTLYQAGPGSLATNPYVPGVRLLLDEQQADLFNTLEAYLDAGGNGVQTADTLHIHRSTLNYRLERIVGILNVDLSDPAIRTNLQIALKLLRLFEVE